MDKVLAEKLASCSLENEKLLEIFKTMETTLESSGAEQAAITIGFSKEAELTVGEFLPLITFSLTRYQPTPDTE